MSEAAEKGDEHRFPDGPFPRLAHNNERQIVIGSHQRVNEADCYCSACQKYC